MTLIETNLQRIKDLCRQHNVKTLSVFGSILTDRFNNDSDIDFLVEFNQDSANLDYVENYLALKEAFESLLKHRIDLFETAGLKNKAFIGNINRTQRIIYG